MARGWRQVWQWRGWRQVWQWRGWRHVWVWIVCDLTICFWFFCLSYFYDWILDNTYIFISNHSLFALASYSMSFRLRPTTYLSFPAAASLSMTHLLTFRFLYTDPVNRFLRTKLFILPDTIASSSFLASTPPFSPIFSMIFFLLTPFRVLNFPFIHFCSWLSSSFDHSFLVLLVF